MSVESILNYRIVFPPIAGGGMATIYKGVYDELEKTVAIKILNPSLSKNEKIRKRFINEAKLMLKLEHKNILKIENLYNQDGILAIIMPLLEGMDLNHYIGNQEVNLTREQIIDITIQTLDGLAYAHHKEVYHRDVKPSNIFITKNNEVKLLDFGIAKIKSEDLSMTGEFLGTPRYSSPEQIKDPKSVDRRTDLYSVGIILYSMLEDKSIYEGLSTTDIQQRIVNEDLPKLENHKEFQVIIDKATAKNPDDRYQTAEKFIYDLMQIKQGNTIIAPNIKYTEDTTVIRPETEIDDNTVIKKRIDKTQEHKKSKIDHLAPVNSFFSKYKKFIFGGTGIIALFFIAFFFVKSFNQPKNEFFRHVNHEIITSENAPTGLYVKYINNFHSGFALIEVDNFYNFVDKDGNILLEKYVAYADDFSDDQLAIVEQKGLLGYINKKGEFQIPPQYYNAMSFYNGKALVEDKTGWHVINKSGKILNDIPDTLYVNFRDNGQNGMILAYGKNSHKYGYISTSGKVKIDFKYSFAKPFRNNIAIISKNGLFGYIKKSGKEITEPKFLYAEDFNFTKTAIISEKTGFGIINQSGKYILEPKYQRITFFNDKYVIFDKFKYALMKPNGDFITDWYDDMIYNSATNTYTVVNGTEYQLINSKGKTIGNKYNFIEELPYSKFVVMKNYRKGIIDVTGKEIVAPNQIIKWSNYYYATLDSASNTWTLFNLADDEQVADALDDIKFLDNFALVQNNGVWELIRDNEILETFDKLIEEDVNNYMILQKSNNLYVVANFNFVKSTLEDIENIENINYNREVVTYSKNQVEVFDKDGEQVFMDDSVWSFYDDQYAYIVEYDNNDILIQNHNNTSGTYSDYFFFAPSIYIVANNEGKWNIVDENNDEMFSTWYDNIDYINEGCISLESEGKIAIADLKGEIITNFIYKTAYNFIDGISRLKNKNNEYVLLNHQGTELASGYDYISYSYPYIIAKKDKEYQLKDIWDNIIINNKADFMSFVDDNILKIKESGEYSLTSVDDNTIYSNFEDLETNYQKTYFILENDNGTYTIIFRDGTLIQNEQYDNIEEYSGYFLTEKNYFSNLIDYKGNKLFPTNYKIIEKIPNKPIFILSGNELYNVYTGKTTSIPEYDNYEYCGIKVCKNSKCGMIDFDGNEVIALDYDSFDFLGDGIARVTKDDKTALIDQNNNVILGWYDDIQTMGEYLYLIDNDDKYAFYNIYGNKISDFYDEFKDVKDNMYMVKKDDLYGIIKRNGKEIIKPQYDYLKKINSEKFLVKKDDKYFIINSNEETLSDKYDYAFTTGSKNNLIIIKKGGRYSIIGEDGEPILDKFYASYATDYSNIIYFSDYSQNYTIVSYTNGEVMGKNFDFGDTHWNYDFYDEKYYLSFSYMDYYDKSNLLLIPKQSLIPGVTATLSFYFRQNTDDNFSSNTLRVYVYNINTGYFDKVYETSSLMSEYYSYIPIRFTPKSTKPLIYIQGLNKSSRYTLYLTDIKLRQTYNITLQIYRN